MRVLFVAPHPDDVCFSVGALAAETSVSKHLVSVFSESAWSEPSWTGGRDSDSVTAAKRSEDCEFATACGLEPHFIGLPDPSVRRPPSPKGPVHHCRMKSKDDPALIAAAEEGLGRLLDQRPFDLVVGPLGVGRHRDHVLCNRAVRAAAHKRRIPVAYYEDLPYSQKLPLWRITLRARRVGFGLRPLVYVSEVPVSLKQEMAAIYRSQYSPVIIRALGEHSDRISEWAGRRGVAVGDGSRVSERLWVGSRTKVPDEFFRSAPAIGHVAGIAADGRVE